jgi:hypothetical protein
MYIRSIDEVRIAPEVQGIPPSNPIGGILIGVALGLVLWVAIGVIFYLIL